MGAGRETNGKGEPFVRCRNVVKYFGGIAALSGISLDLWPGEVVCLVGDNGAGKSTFVKILSGIHHRDEGELSIGGTPVKDLSPQRARELGIDTVYQDLALCENLGAAANVMLGQEPARFRLGPVKVLDERRARHEAQRLISQVGITLAETTTPVRRLSGGQRQAIAIARALVRGHRLIIFDEPTAALGVRQTKTTLDLIRAAAEQGVGVLMISHNLDDVFAVAQRIVAMRLGRAVLDAYIADTSREEVIACMTGMSQPAAR